MLIRYEVRIGDDIHGIFRVPQNTDLLNDDEYDLYYEFYNELPCKKLEELGVAFYFTEYGDKMQNECWFITSVIKAIPLEYRDKDIELLKHRIQKPEKSEIVYEDNYQIAIKI